ncbi:hypothetical protein J6590_014131 [Homalodisca vitripennis]|nr:hypothetical protein J6590_014131 [Homalodisca vitripennis]
MLNMYLFLREHDEPYLKQLASLFMTGFNRDCHDFFQRSFLRLVGVRRSHHYGNVPIEDIPAELDLPHLQLRRDLMDIGFLYIFLRVHLHFF